MKIKEEKNSFLCFFLSCSFWRVLILFFSLILVTHVPLMSIHLTCFFLSVSRFAYFFCPIRYIICNISQREINYARIIASKVLFWFCLAVTKIAEYFFRLTANIEKEKCQYFYSIKSDSASLKKDENCLLNSFIITELMVPSSSTQTQKSK